MHTLLRGSVAALYLAGLTLAPIAGAQQAAPARTVWLDTLDLSAVSQGYGEPRAAKSVDGGPLTLAGKTYLHGIGTHAASEFNIDLKGAATKFTAVVGVDDEKKGQGSVVFQVFVDGRKKGETPVLHGGDAPLPLSVDITGALRLSLVVTDAGDGNTNDHADWADASLALAPGTARTPTALVPTPEPTMPIFLGADSPVPAIHGPRIVGAAPHHPFLFRIPATGTAPLIFTAQGLPAGLTLSKATGVISGALAKAGTSHVRLTVQGPRGKASRALTIVGGAHTLALTPPLGWNSWNVWAGAVDDQKVRAAADQLIAAGLAAHGYSYVNIDDTWETKAGPGVTGRDAKGVILTNAKFPNMPALASYVHSKGLRIGIYSSPGPTTCGGYIASWQHEQQDADTYASWGIDYLKYDWCSYEQVATGAGLERQVLPYRVMGAALAREPRDIVFSLCQYGMGDVWNWGASVGGNAWRTTGDIQDNWNSLRSIGFSQNGRERHAGPGHWNDMDMLMVGIVGFGNTHPTHLTPNEQITHITQWSLLSSPLLIGCDLTRLDPFTKALLTNDDVLDVNQDPLGKPAARVGPDGDTQVYARPLWDGTQAVGLFNLGSAKAAVHVAWAQIGRTGPQPVRDLWQHKDLGRQATGLTVSIPAHGAMLIKVGKPTITDSFTVSNPKGKA